MRSGCRPRAARSTPASASRTSAMRSAAVLPREAPAAGASFSGVMNTTSAVRAARSKIGAACASRVTTICPCGERGTIDGPMTENPSPSKSMWCTRSRSRKRPVSRSRMIASSSQLSQSRRATSAASAASATRASSPASGSPANTRSMSSSGAGRRPNASAEARSAEKRSCQPARPPETWSSVCSAVATWNGSVCVVVTVGMSPMLRVRGASQLAVSSASRRPSTRAGSRVRDPAGASGPGSGAPCSRSASSKVT